MTEINTREIDPAAVRQIAEELMLGRARDIDRLDIHRQLVGDPDLSAEDRERWADEVLDMVNKAEVTVTFPEASGS